MPEILDKPPEQEYMTQEQHQITTNQQAEASVLKIETDTNAKREEEKKAENIPKWKPAGDTGIINAQDAAEGRGSIVRSELNLEQNSVFTVSTYREKSREIIFPKEIGPDGAIHERRATIGKTAGGIETGVLTTYHFKVYLALLNLWEKSDRPINGPVHFTILKIIKQLGLSHDGRTYARMKRWLLDLGQIPLTFVNSFFIPEEGTHQTLDPFHILSYLRVYERKKTGELQKTYGYGEFQFDRHILENLVNNHTHPLRLDVITSFEKRKDLAILLYTYVDRNLAMKSKYEVGLEKLFNHLDLSQNQIRYPADRKAKIEPVLEQIRGKPLSTGTLSRCYIDKTEDGKDYKLVCQKKSSSSKLEAGTKEPLQLIPQSELEPEEPDSELLSALIDKGLTEKQGEKLISEQGEEVVKAQLEYLPFRLEAYKSQGRDVKEAAIFYDSIKDNWQPPTSYSDAQKGKEKEAKRQSLAEELAERAKKAKTEAEEWATRPTEDRIKGPLDFWIEGEKICRHHEPTEEEIEARKQELIAGLPTVEEYEQGLIGKIEREISEKESKI